MFVFYLCLSQLCSLTGDVWDCRENFFRDETFSYACVPECPSWRGGRSVASSTAADVVVIFAYSTGFITAVVILVISLIRYKAM